MQPQVDIEQLKDVFKSLFTKMSLETRVYALIMGCRG